MPASINAALPPGLPSVSLSYARALQKFLLERGLARGDNREIPTTAQQVPTVARVAGDAFGQTLIDAARALGEHATGLAFGSRIGGGGFGLLGVAVATAATLRESILNLGRFEALTSTLGRIGTRRDADIVTLTWRPVQPVVPAVAEGILTGWISYGRYLIGERAEVLHVTFAHRRSAPLQAYETALQCPVRFDASEHSVSFAADLLDAQPRFADPRFNTALGLWLDQCTSTIARPLSCATTRRVATLLCGAMKLADADEDSVAAALSLERRSLQRRLAEEGTSFRQILDALRAQYAVVALLSGTTSLVQLSADVGFDQQSSLCRAFRRWTGYAPLQVRQRLADVFTENALLRSRAS